MNETGNQYFSLFALTIFLNWADMSRQRNQKSSRSWNLDKFASDHACSDQGSGNRCASHVERDTPYTQKFVSVYSIVLSIVVVLIAGLLTLTVTIHFANHHTTTAKATAKSKPLLTEEELLKHDGSNPDIPIYISILGRIYNVDKGRRHYEVGSGYNVFAGRDSTPSFVTGVFAREQATDDVKGLSPEEMLGIKEWLDFYKKDYTYVGKLIGRYYDSEGNPTEALNEAKAVIKKGQKLKKLQEAENKRFPGCNSRWSVEEGSTVWCSENRYALLKCWQIPPSPSQKSLIIPGREGMMHLLAGSFVKKPDSLIDKKTILPMNRCDLVGLDWSRQSVL